MCNGEAVRDDCGVCGASGWPVCGCWALSDAPTNRWHRPRQRVVRPASRVLRVLPARADARARAVTACASRARRRTAEASAAARRWWTRAACAAAATRTWAATACASAARWRRAAAAACRPRARSRRRREASVRGANVCNNDYGRDSRRRRRSRFSGATARNAREGQPGLTRHDGSLRAMRGRGHWKSCSWNGPLEIMQLERRPRWLLLAMKLRARDGRGAGVRHAAARGDAATLTRCNAETWGFFGHNFAVSAPNRLPTVAEGRREREV